MRPSKRKKERERERVSILLTYRPSEYTLRSADAFNKEHIPGAVQLSGDELLVALPEDKATPILLYCNSGRRSAAAANAVVGLGYTDVLNLEPGIKGWKAAGMPVA